PRHGARGAKARDCRRRLNDRDQLSRLRADDARARRDLYGRSSVIVAVDGPAASGKGTLARALARHYGLHYLDTGSLYRAVGQPVLAAGGAPTDETAARAAAVALDAARIDEKAIRTAEAGHAASVVAAMPVVRAAILDLQRRFAAQKPGAVLD